MTSMNINDAVNCFIRAGCRVPGFGNGCATCPIRKELGVLCTGNDEKILYIASKLYRTNKKYRANVNIELEYNPALKNTYRFLQK